MKILNIVNVSIILLHMPIICNCFLSNLGDSNRIKTSQWKHRQQQLPSLQKHYSSKITSTKSKKFQTDKILKREGRHFVLDRFKGKVEFGTTADLITSFPSPSANTGISSASMIAKWLKDEKRVALSIWDPKLIKEIGTSKYRLQMMKLQFVTLELAPTVDVDMWTEGSPENPIFYLESGDFNPNVRAPGISITSLDIQIKVVGTMEVSSDGKGVTGKLGFVSSGILPPPLRLLPEIAVQKATELINDTVKQFAITSFQKGAVLEYRKFLRSEEMNMRINNKKSSD